MFSFSKSLLVINSIGEESASTSFIKDPVVIISSTSSEKTKNEENKSKKPLRTFGLIITNN